MDSTVAVATMWATVTQAVGTIGLLVTAILSFVWVYRTFRHEEAKVLTHTAFQLSQLSPEQVGATTQDLDWDNLMHWMTNFWGRGNQGIILPPQQISCFLTNLGPGVVSSAEVPYTLTVYDFRPLNDAVPPRETHPGRFRFYYVTAGQARPAVNSVNTAFYPFFRIVLGEAIVRGITGSPVGTPPVEELTRKYLEYDNTPWWQAVANQQRTAAQPNQPQALVPQDQARR
ncbi:MAG: hypothetical protein ACRDIY_05370 [Chloroflexota bacterium]